MAVDSISSSQNRIILGLLTFGPNIEWGAKVTSLDDFNACLDFFQSEGYHEVDTSRLYHNGQQESFTAKAGWKKRGLKLATKLYPTQPGLHGRQVLMENVEESLRNLNTDSVDLFYLHAPDRSVPFTETLEAVNDLHQAGKIKEFGLSNFSAFEIAEIVITCNERGWVRPTVCQVMYNALKPELIPACRRYGIDVVVYNPLAGGLLTGKFSGNDPERNHAVGELSQVDKTYRARYLRNASLEALRLIEPVVRDHGLTLIETALRWLLHHSALKLANDGNDGILIGASSLVQLKSNCADLNKGPLPTEVVRALDDGWQVAKAETPTYWFGALEYTYDTKQTLFGSQNKP